MIAETTRHTPVPVPLTPLIGRAIELLDLEDLLRNPAVRLVTVTGPGGVGKTRLATRLAASQQAAFPDGVWYIPLEAIREPDLVMPAMAQATGLADDGSGDLADQLAALIASGACLCVLDNFEQVADAGPVLADLLQRCPRFEDAGHEPDIAGPVRRARIPARPSAIAGLTGRWEFLGAPAITGDLALPGAGEGVDPRFTLNDSNAGDVLEICRRLDGLPLAIELAAARIKVLTPAALLDRLTDRLRVLTSGARNLPVRQQTMRGAIAWSYELLSPDDQEVFRLLSVFAGGFDLDLLDALLAGVAASPGALAPVPDPMETLDRVSALVDQSLLQQPAGPAGQSSRFALFQVIREFAAAELAEHDDESSVRNAHADVMADLIERASPHFGGPDQIAWLDRLEAEHDNIRAALSFALRQLDANRAHRLGALLWSFWTLRGHQQEGRRWYEQILALPGDADSLDRAHCLRGAGEIAWEQGRYAESTDALHQALAAARAHGEQRLEASIIGSLANIAYGRGNFDEARRLHREAIAIHESTGDQRGLAGCYNNLGTVSFYLSDLDDAEAEYGRAQVLLEALGDRRAALVVLGNIGNVARTRGESERASQIQEQVLAGMRAIGDERGVASALVNLGTAYLERDDLDQAEPYIVQGIEIFDRLGIKRAMAIAQLSLAEIGMKRGANASAIDRALESLANMIDCGDVASSAVVVGMLGELANTVGDPILSARLFGGSHALRESVNTEHSPEEAEDFEPIVARTRDALGDDDFAAAWDGGREATLTELASDAAMLRAIATSTPQSRQDEVIARETGLSPREVEVLRLFAAGHSNQAIADALAIPVAEVVSNVGRIYTKLGVDTRAAATAFAFKTGLV